MYVVVSFRFVLFLDLLFVSASAPAASGRAHSGVWASSPSSMQVYKTEDDLMKDLQDYKDYIVSGDVNQVRIDDLLPVLWSP